MSGLQARPAQLTPMIISEKTNISQIDLLKSIKNLLCDTDTVQYLIVSPQQAQTKEF